MSSKHTLNPTEESFELAKNALFAVLDLSHITTSALPTPSQPTSISLEVLFRRAREGFVHAIGVVAVIFQRPVEIGTRVVSSVRSPRTMPLWTYVGLCAFLCSPVFAVLGWNTPLASVVGIDELVVLTKQHPEADFLYVGLVVLALVGLVGAAWLAVNIRFPDKQKAPVGILIGLALVVAYMLVDLARTELLAQTIFRGNQILFGLFLALALIAISSWALFLLTKIRYEPVRIRREHKRSSKRKSPK